MEWDLKVKPLRKGPEGLLIEKEERQELRAKSGRVVFRQVRGDGCRLPESGMPKKIAWR